MTEQALCLPIGAVERETRVSKELLRMWERRYGFPAPQRDEAGDRLYTHDDVDKLKLIRLLIDRGFRPGRLMSMSISALRELQSGGSRPVPALPEARGPGEEALYLLQRRDAEALRRWFSQMLTEQGLRRFITQTLRQTNEAVGQAWQRGQLAIHEEHLYAELAHATLRQAVHQLYPLAQPPRIMLTTVPDEAHRLGLLMVEVMLRLEQCDLLSFGTEMPLADIAEAAIAHKVDIIALSFSGAYGAANAQHMLQGLAAQLPARVQIWVGGAGVQGLQTLPDSVRVIQDLNLLGPAIADWRASRR
jgi:DNA-binding transcriptional MerR regulator/methylmalonyl-CoA mutase cobalamin-binding subunit